MMRTITLSIALSACSPPHIQQPRAGTAVATIVAIEIEPSIDPSVRASIALDLCRARLPSSPDVQAASYHYGVTADEYAVWLCQRTEVWGAFARELDDATIQQLERARIDATRAADIPCPALGRDCERI